MENCQCTGSSDRPPCSAIDTNRLTFNTHEDLSGLIFTRSSALKLLGFDCAREIQGLPNTFPSFPRLPAELRLNIWHFALSEPRLIVVSYTTATGEDDRRLFVDVPPPHPCLLACRESRVEALKLYSKHLITTQCRLPKYLNFTNDWFLLGGPDASLDMDYLISLLLPGNAHRVRFLHVSRGCWKQIAYWTDLRERYSGLEKLVISFPIGAALLPYTHACWYGELSRSNKESVVRIELYGDGEDEPRWTPDFALQILHYDSPSLEGKVR